MASSGARTETDIDASTPGALTRNPTGGLSCLLGSKLLRGPADNESEREARDDTEDKAKEDETNVGENLHHSSSLLHLSLGRGAMAS